MAIEICVSNEQKQIANNIVNGSIWYVDRIDSYTYIAPETGTYRFDFSCSNVNNSYGVNLYDMEDNNILIEQYFSYDGKNVELVAGKKYLIQIEQRSGTEEYIINIGAQQPTR